MENPIDKSDAESQEQNAYAHPEIKPDLRNIEVSDSENDIGSDTETCCGDQHKKPKTDESSPIFSFLRSPGLIPQFTQMQFPKTNYYFPAAMEAFESPTNHKRRSFGTEFISQLSRDSDILESTITQMTQDLERFVTPASSPRTPSIVHRYQSPRRPHPAAGDTPCSKFNQSYDDSQSDSTPVTRPGSPCVSINMLVHKSMENPARKANRQNLRSKLTTVQTQRLQQELYDSLGEKPNNLTEENQLLYQTLDYERKKLILRKGLCNFMYGALKRQGQRVEILESRNRVKNEECAARLIFHQLLLHAYRKVQDQVTQLVVDNNELQKSVENVCLQLRVVRHLQTAEKERAIEKIHEIGSLKNELGYAKKMLKRTKAELEKTEKDCEEMQQSNVELSEEKNKLQREFHVLEDKKEMLESSLEIEKKRTEKQMNEAKNLKRQASEIRRQIGELNIQCDQWQERCRDLESKNWDLHLLLESRGKEFSELGKNRDCLKLQIEELQQLNLEFQTRKETLEIQLKKEMIDSLKVKKALGEAEIELLNQTTRIDILEKEIEKMHKERLVISRELASYKLKNIRKRRAWVNLAMRVTSPLASILQYFIIGGSEQSRPDQFIKWAGNY